MVQSSLLCVTYKLPMFTTLSDAGQAFSCEACSSMRPPSNAAAQQEEDGFGSNSAQANGHASQGEDKGKKKGKAPKFERLRLTGVVLPPVCIKPFSINLLHGPNASAPPLMLQWLMMLEMSLQSLSHAAV